MHFKKSNVPTYNIGLKNLCPNPVYIGSLRGYVYKFLKLEVLLEENRGGVITKPEGLLEENKGGEGGV